MEFKMRFQQKAFLSSALALYLVSLICLTVGLSAQAKGTGDPIVIMETNKGVIKVDIYQNDAPKTAANFVDLVKKGFYNGLTFHRYEPGFCIQGGDAAGTGSGPGYMEGGKERTVPLEVSPKLRHDSAGVIAMARTDDPNSASTQFYFTLGPAGFLDMKYAVFGRVVDGLSVVKELRKGDKMTKVYLQK